LANLLLVKRRLVALFVEPERHGGGTKTLNRQDWRWLVCAAAACAAAAAPAHAQTYRRGSAAGIANNKIAGATASALDKQVPTGVTGQFEATYDSNVARRRTTLGPLPIQKQDEIFRPSGLVNVTKAVGREELFLNGSAGYDFYRVNTFLNRERLNFEGGVNAPLGRCKSTLSGAFSRHSTDLADVDVIINNAESHETIALQGDCSQLIGVAPEFTVSQGWLQNSTTLRSPLNHSDLSFEGGLTYSRPALGQLTAFGNYEHVEFPGALGVPGAANGYGYKVYSGGARLTHNLGARIQGEAQISYEDLQTTIPGSAGFQGVAYSFDVTYKASGKVTTHFIFSRQNEPSNRLGATFVTEEVYSGSVSYQVGARIKLDLAAARKTKDYGALAPGIAPPSVRNETLTEFDGTLNYDLSKRLTASLEFVHDVRDSPTPAFDYTSNRVSVQLQSKFF
jgi:hypothetical protein